MEPINSEHGKVAFEFATSIVNGDFAAAYGFLTKQQKSEWSPSSLKGEYEEMIDYTDGPINHIEVMNEMTEWPTKREADIGWAYIVMSGVGYSEAVAVVVCKENNELKIRGIEWGRP